MTGVLNKLPLRLLKVNFQAKAQGKVNTYAKMKRNKYCKKGLMSCKTMWKMVWLNSWHNCSDMFRKVIFLKFQGKHEWWRPLLPRRQQPQLAAWNTTKYSSIIVISLLNFWNWWQLQSYPLENCDQLPVKLPRLRHLNTSSIPIVRCFLIWKFMMPITVNKLWSSINLKF